MNGEREEDEEVHKEGREEGREEERKIMSAIDVKRAKKDGRSRYR